MATYTTSSGFSDLKGSMVVTNNNADSYTSDTLGTVTPQKVGGAGLNFNVRFTSVTPPRTYNIRSTANANGNGYSGNANNNRPAAGEESWSATATTADAVTSASDTDDASTADVAPKTAAV